MATAAPFVVPFQLSDAGAPLSGGQLFTYAWNTSTPKPTYSDGDGVTLNTNPIILNSAGRYRCFLAPGPYKFVLRDKNGGLIWTSPKINGTTGNLQIVNTIQELRALGADSSAYVMVMGYYVAGDIAPRVFTWNGSIATLDNGGMIIKPSALANDEDGRWTGDWDGDPISVRVFGAKGNGVDDDYPFVVNAQNWASENKTGITYTPTQVNYIHSAYIEYTVPVIAMPRATAQYNGVSGGFSCKFLSDFKCSFNQFFLPPYYTGNVVDLSNARLEIGACPEWFGADPRAVDFSDDALLALLKSNAIMYSFIGSYRTTNDITSDLTTGLAGKNFWSRGVVIWGSTVLLQATLQVFNFKVLNIATITGLLTLLAGASVLGDVSITGDLLMSGTASVGSDLELGGDADVVGSIRGHRNITAGQTQEGYLRQRSGGGSMFGTAITRIAENTTTVGNVGSAKQNLLSFAISAETLVNVGDSIIVETQGLFGPTANVRRIWFSMQNSATSAITNYLFPIYTPINFMALGAQQPSQWHIRLRITKMAGNNVRISGLYCVNWSVNVDTTPVQLPSDQIRVPLGTFAFDTSVQQNFIVAAQGVADNDVTQDQMFVLYDPVSSVPS